MKITVSKILIPALLIFLTVSCKKKETNNEVPTDYPATYTYDVAIEPVTADYLAPALQSFVHGRIDDNWVLFAGRTNGEDPIGGLHNLNADYSLKSFPPKSFNKAIYTFNPITGTESVLTYDDMLQTITDMGNGTQNEPEDVQAACTKVAAILKNYGNIFQCSNPQALQSGDYLYVTGGYGSPVGVVPTKGNYQTFDAIARINIPLLIRITNADWSLTAAEWMKLFRFGTNSTLQVTGGELKKAGDQFYLAGGHKFDSLQVYSNAVFKFEFNDDTTTLALTANILDTISDMTSAELKTKTAGDIADRTSVFRRRDLPVVSSLYLDKNNELAPNFALMSGVFKYGEKTLAAWNDAIYITPDAVNSYYVDKKHNQYDTNVYSCPDFAIYDASSNEIHTFLPGGIGNGKADDFLSGFTNTMGYNKYNIKSLESNYDTISNAFPSKYFYGAEAEFMPSSNIKYLIINGEETDVIDSESTFNASNTVQIGYIYGGIEAYEDSPSTFGKGKSGASNKIWKVTVTRTPLEYEK
ncbi:hypothetical protein LX97_01970 [Nonlabens dokdonensis]|jgi:hypothetical protein|uniref:Lipoprotein n=2 Tax=Nonlabens dokdonensis TaxID=328515 RepID=L7WCQ7_NONDD|nr:hypothetical protein [Nonlabens dokdonensis]AGC77854.1 hypothetical protein DDD_2727 [Nonlabens dokdonensis DSW-6]PZX39616.1 hypothetical protein LX97_01970 [Nonlabens dokdonensis]